MVAICLSLNVLSPPPPHIEIHLPTNDRISNHKSQPCNKCILPLASYSHVTVKAMGINTSRPRQNGRCFADDTFKRNFLNENVRIFIKISLKFIHKGSINHIPALVQIMAWRRPDDKSLSEPMVIYLLTHICVSRPQWVKNIKNTLKDSSNNTP